MPDTSTKNTFPDGIPFSKALAILGISLFLGISFDYLFYGETPGLNFPIYILLVSGGLFTVSCFSQRAIDRRTLWLFVPIAFFSAMVFVRANEFLTTINIFACVLLLFLVAATILTKTLGNLTIFGFFSVAISPVRFVEPGIQTVAQMTSRAEGKWNKERMTRIVKGFLLAAPVVFVFFVMLMSADMIFRQYTSDIFDQLLVAETIGRTILILFCSLFFAGAYTYVFLAERGAPSSPTWTLPKRNYHVELSIVLGCVNALFLLFMLVQFAYFFGGGQYVEAKGFTYSEYARSGFFELIDVAVLSFLLMVIADRFGRNESAGHGLLFKCLAGGVVAQTLLIMLSAFMRLSLYEGAYGFTELRLSSHLFIVFLAAVFLLLLYKTVIDNNERAFALRTLIVMILSVAALNVLNPDSFVARQNVTRFHKTGKLDTRYLSELSSDATPEIVPLLGEADGAVKDSVVNALYQKYQQESHAQLALGWQSRHWSREESISIIEATVIKPGLKGDTLRR